jgi:FAD binding domain
LNIDPGNLRETIDKMSRFAQVGRDVEFERGSTVYQNHNGDPVAGGINPNLGPIATAPFYAVRLYPSDIGTSGGLVTDDAARVLDSSNQPSRDYMRAEMTCSRLWGEHIRRQESRSGRP